MKPTQKQRVLNLLQGDGTIPGRWVHMSQLNAVCYAYSQRLGELRKAGYKTETKRSKDGAWYYRLTGVPAELAAGNDGRGGMMGKEMFWIHFNDHRDWVQVEGESVIIPGFEQYQFFIHKNPDEENEYRVSEFRTGAVVGKGDNPAAAIDDAARRLGEGKDQIEGRIAHIFQRWGFSPDWKAGEIC